jgi:uncharacterized protein (DUF169 family)
MSPFATLFKRFLASYEDDSVRIPCCGLWFARNGEADRTEEFSRSPKWIEPNHFQRTLASCGYSYKAARGGWTLKVTAENIGCPAGAMSLGLVSSDSTRSFEGGCYVASMARPATPQDFTAGYVYAPHQSGHSEFALFGDQDCGRYETHEAALKAVQSMPVIPPVMDAVYYYHPLLSEVEVEPDIIHVYCTPLQAMRLIQGYCFPTGERFTMSCLGIRGVSCDMTAWPYVNQDINGTFLCLGARGISNWEEEYVGFGMPMFKFEEVVVGMEKSKKGFPYKIFPKSIAHERNLRQ